jgi:preprotein translocase subunit SecE
VTADRIKMTVAVLVLAAGIGGYYYLGDRALALRVLTILGAFVVAVVIALQTEPGRAAAAFTRESTVELRKVVWPTRKETAQVTMVVVAMVIFVAIFLWFVDWALLAGVKALTGQGS